MGKRQGGIVRRVLRLALLASLAWIAVTILAVVSMRAIDPPFTMFMTGDWLDSLRAGGPAFDYQWRDWSLISPHAALAVVAAEDQQFPYHHGFDFKQIDRALTDRERGRRVRGASTISQQVAKNLFLWRGQSWFRKGLEAGITLLIETTWSKQRILEVYLNVAEFGPGTYGVQAASRRFYAKDAARLTRSEAALLAAVLPAPTRFKVQAPTRYVRSRQAWIQRQMAALGGTAYLARL